MVGFLRLALENIESFALSTMIELSGGAFFLPEDELCSEAGLHVKDRINMDPLARANIVWVCEKLVVWGCKNE